jgi:hypothetical protein
MQLTVQNDALRAAYDPATGVFTITGVGSAHTSTVSATLTDVSGSARVEAVRDGVFGVGQAIIVHGAQGDGRLSVFPKLPFALLRRTIRNGGSAAATFNRLDIAALRVDLGKPASALRTFGTGGLGAPAAALGSYAWLAVADPATRAGVVAGWLTGDRASGVLFPNVTGDAVTVAARSDYGRLLLDPGQSAETETLTVGGFADARLGLEAWADAVARQLDIHLPAQPAGFCTWYAEKHGGASDEVDLATLTDFAARELKPWGFDFVQIDDGWQRGHSEGNGPKKDFTDFRPDGPYPSGMKAMADTIRAHGLTPGIWFMPFAGTHNDPFFADKQSLFVKHEDGTPYDTAWGGTSIDMTNPDARRYLASWVGKIAHNWGYKYFKMDGLYTGIGVKQTYVNYGYKEDDFGNAVFADPKKTNIDAFREGFRVVRDAAGPNVFLLGCCSAQNMRSYEGAFGMVDGMRIGADNSGSWAGWLHSSPLSGSRNYFLNGRIWYNDPDPFYVRASLSEEEARTTASWSAIADGLNSNSDWLPDLPPDRVDILRRTMPAHGKAARPVDLFENDPPRLWTVTDDKAATRRDVVALFNWSDAPENLATPVTPLGLPAAREYVGFDYWANAFVAPFRDTLNVALPPHGCKIIAVRPVLDHPFLLSTSRHVTQGMTDIAREEWKGRTLSGESRVVGGDAYELRVYAPAAPRDWKAVRVEVSAEDRAAGVTANVHQAGSEVRVALTTPQSRGVRWQVVFE